MASGLKLLRQWWIGLDEEKRAQIQHFQAFRFRKLLNLIYGFVFGRNLDYLAALYSSDKGLHGHGYTPVYARHFAPLRTKRLNLLEIGIGGWDDPKMGGGSLRMWRTYFPRSRVFGIDIYDKQPHQESRIRTFKGSQTDETFLSGVVRTIGRIDIVIDDGSHHNRDVLQTFAFLFPHLSQNGLYVIEDTQTSYWPEYGGSSENLDEPTTTMGFLKRLADGLNYSEFHIRTRDPSDYDKSIVALHFYHNIVFVQKGCN